MNIAPQTVDNVAVRFLKHFYHTSWDDYVEVKNVYLNKKYRLFCSKYCCMQNKIVNTFCFVIFDSFMMAQMCPNMAPIF